MVLIFPTKKMKAVFHEDLFRIDERDTIFSRFDLKKSSHEFKEFYKKKPEFAGIDEKIRKLPGLFSTPHLKKNPSLLSLADAEFDFIEHQITQVDGKVNNTNWGQSSSENFSMIQSYLSYLGAAQSGICLLNKSDVYSHVGRGPEKYGSPIIQSHKFAIAFAVEMDYEMISYAPRPPVVVETARQYVEATRISIILAHFIRKIGFPARAHISGSNYQVMPVPCAVRAGLGELGRVGILVNSKLGPRLRLGIVTTDLPLETGNPVDFGVESFCRKCMKCAHNCPSQAIPYGEKEDENGSLRWIINREKCYEHWLKSGTDCAICMRVCPYSKPDNFFHNIIRFAVRKSAFAQSLSIRGDDFFYGKKPVIKKNNFLL